MIYFANPCGSDRIATLMQAGRLGFIATPKQSNPLSSSVRWCADNGCFAEGYPGDDAFVMWLLRFQQNERTRCAFAVAPDVVGDAKRTLERSRPLLHVIRGIGFPVALVAQDGLERLRIPWDEFDALFIGGSTEWKLGPAAREIASEATFMYRKWLHMGRVNSRERLRYANDLCCDSVDGTLLTYGPDIHAPRVDGWLREIDGQLEFDGVIA